MTAAAFAAVLVVVVAVLGFRALFCRSPGDFNRGGGWDNYGDGGDS